MSVRAHNDTQWVGCGCGGAGCAWCHGTGRIHGWEAAAQTAARETGNLQQFNAAVAASRACTACRSTNVQVLDRDTGSARCRSCENRFTQPPMLPFVTDWRTRYPELVTP